MAAHRISPISLAGIQKLIGGEVIGSPDFIIAGISSLEDAEQNDLSYAVSDHVLKAVLASKAAAFIVARRLPELNKPQLVVAHPAYAFARLAQILCPKFHPAPGVAAEVIRGLDVEIGADVSISPFVTLGDRTKIAARVTLYPGVFVGSDCAIGEECVLYPNVVVREGCLIGARVIIHSGTVIGSDGFAYVQHQGRNEKVPQLGGVTIEDDVELGANVTVDRATFGQTIIRRGTKVDNLVQIAHNVTIGEDSILVAQVGIAGSTRLGHHVMIGGQAGLTDHVEVGDHVMVAARSGVNRSLEPNQIVAGAPVMPHETFLRSQAVIPRLPELRQRVRELEKRVAVLESKGKSRARQTKRPSKRPKTEG
jgi:UDP-3-O-[3-hydroxymyristoyl] glucosamine N-acyltransferase